MKNIKKKLLFHLIFACTLMLSVVVYAESDGLPDGWSFHCEGTTGVYIGPNGSFMIVPNHSACGGSSESPSI